jgi:hypothetical protein
MAVAVAFEGTTTASIGTEHDLATATAANVYSLQVQLINMVDPTATTVATGDVLEIREYSRVRATSTDDLVRVYSMVGAQSDDFFRTTPIVTPHYVRYTLKQTSATVGRVYNWAIYSVQ